MSRGAEAINPFTDETNSINSPDSPDTLILLIFSAVIKPPRLVVNVQGYSHKIFQDRIGFSE